ncbi:lipase family protein [Parachitinimonas caeni]|uniref:Lipase family protein n=1 Tax=Parachitinimonas caeni TaxID=3031301 RepID=A0ABT7DT39_9NEIS|nr:lipase family protein [Parachitinimonas caeni]MDK2122949.1 lipase family protein [Parachitinimonas caeni]
MAIKVGQSDKGQVQWNRHAPHKAMVRTNRMTSALEVSVSKGPDGKVYVAFKGTDGKRPGTCAADALGAFGVADSSFRMARDLVKEMVAMHGADNVHVVGHSLGGTLAQFAGIKAGVPVTCFNSMGLPGHLCDKLIDLRELGSGQSKLKQAHVEHINSEGDALSQKLQTRYLPFGLTQVGERYKVEGASGHSINAKNGLLSELNKLAPDQA